MKKILIIFGISLEAVNAGTVILVGTDTDKNEGETTKLLNNKNLYHKMSTLHNHNGDENACKRIVEQHIKN